ncbi:xanthine dehydrogenase accessory protein pucB [Anoxybacillus tepidamans]|uniref:Xanthine dehydrogenase accessory protein pucB n=1 Tax=Anoxybacteroides tepidamans TaxID=265948 RepID=A0A7W8ISI9_9BACL|nr:nucleotidyltransferase family protein [Anoxybacillus tepidamans]MBB5325027.1 xanthine dehydrogenase accessory protein pucB [Anoxybacillus tepidamans]
MKFVKITGIFLAAGKSERMGENKLSLPLKDKAIGSVSLYTAVTSELDHVFVITREDDPLDWIDYGLRTEKLRNRWTVVPCREAGKGQSFSLKAGLCKAEEEKADGVVVLLADQPFITTDMINELIFQYEQHLNTDEQLDFVASMFQGVLRPPVLLSKRLFQSLKTLKGDVGAQQMIRQNSNLNGISITYKDRKAFFDIDTKEDYQLAREGGVKNESIGGKSLDPNGY